MDRNVHFLNAIFQDASASFRSIDALLPKAQDSAVADEMQRQLDEYRNISLQAEALIGVYQATPKKESPLAKISDVATKKLASALNDSPPHIAQLLIKEGTQGVANMTRTVKEFCCCDQPVAQLGEHLLRARQKNVEELKKYL